MRGSIAIALLLLAGCGRSDTDRRPGDLTADEERSLNDAAAMLDADSVDANAVEGADGND